MNKLKELEVSGLFRHVSHHVRFNQNPSITIVAGPNGAGKTHLLRLLRGMLAFDVQALMGIQFDTATLTFRNEKKLLLVKTQEPNDEKSLRVVALNRRNTPIDELLISETETSDDNGVFLPDYIVQVGDRTFVDVRNDRTVPLSYVRARWGYHSGAAKKKSTRADHPEIQSLLGDVSPILIDTKRLDTSFLAQQAEAKTTQRTHGNPSPAKQYIEQVKSQIVQARSESLAQSQQADRSFAARALDTGSRSAAEGELRAMYASLSDLHSELFDNGLAAQSIDVKLPEAKRMGSAERRILTIFLRDWEDKLKPLIPVNTKLNSLRRIVNQKFLGKELIVNRRGDLTFENIDHEEIPVDALSSGEQHMLALFTMLLFSADPGSVVLIDEPEISLHAAWKHAFLDDIEEVSGLSDIEIVLATHSSAIINGRWELVEELGVQE